MIKVSKAQKSDILQVAQIANKCFRGYGSFQGAKKWITCNFNAFPRAQYFIAKEKGKALGYILWLEKGGFRKEAVWELEQIGVSLNYQGRGVATKLISDSLATIKKNLKKRGSSLKLIEITTGLHQAPKLYQKTLGAKKEVVLKDFFRGDEMILVARFK
ncbi:MAG: GNAT family N-acetyltransferase [Candidatus Pacebacteria bacterium]|nr:GNAT family N-acetyltransferase [Candidatus Paceibacterota bacterium]